jgi:hypothetical protein
MSGGVVHRCSTGRFLPLSARWRAPCSTPPRVPPSKRAPEFFSLAPLLAVALLATNDHFFKAAFHNALTGKLSDFAGCFFLPLYVSAMLAWVTRWSLERRLWAGALTTLAIFVPVSVSRAAADFVCRAVELVAIPAGLGTQHSASDPTDLIAVPMICLAVLYAQRVNRCAASSN